MVSFFQPTKHLKLTRDTRLDLLELRRDLAPELLLCLETLGAGHEFGLAVTVEQLAFCNPSDSFSTSEYILGNLAAADEHPV